MAKGLRSKVKRSFRRLKREDSIYAATHAARVDRLHSKLAHKIITDKEGDMKMIGEEGEEDSVPEAGASLSEAVEDTPMEGAEPKEVKISTHGKRDSRKEEWRRAKGITKPNKRAQMTVMGSKKGSGKSKRRR